MVWQTALTRKFVKKTYEEEWEGLNFKKKRIIKRVDTGLKSSLSKI